MKDDKPAYLRPGVSIKFVNKLVSLLGVAPTLAVRGRKSGKWRKVPVNVVTYADARYLVSPRGETDWARNLRAAGGGELRRRGKHEAFTAVEIAPADRPPIIAVYRGKWDKQVKAYFEQLPNASDHPTFRITPTV